MSEPSFALRLSWDADWLENASGIHPDDIADNLVPVMRAASARLSQLEAIVIDLAYVNSRHVTAIESLRDRARAAAGSATPEEDDEPLNGEYCDECSMFIDGKATHHKSWCSHWTVAGSATPEGDEQ
jgi:hypothetical protein